MRLIKKFYLEIIFICLLAITLIISFVYPFPRGANFLNVFKVNNPKEMVRNEEVRETVCFEEYLSWLKSLDNCTVLITVKDIQGFSLTKEMTDGLAELGFTQTDILLEHEYHGFIGVLINNIVTYQNICNDEAIVYKDYIDDRYVVIKSETLSQGNSGIIYIDNVEYSPNQRGINIVVWDNSTDTIIDSIAYDTHDENIPAYTIQNGSVIMISERTVQDVE